MVIPLAQYHLSVVVELCYHVLQAGCAGCGVTVISLVPTREVTAQTSKTESLPKIGENETYHVGLLAGLGKQWVTPASPIAHSPCLQGPVSKSVQKFLWRLREERLPLP